MPFCRPFLLLWTVEVLIEEIRVFLVNVAIGLDDVIFGFEIIVLTTRDPRRLSFVSVQVK